MAPTAIETAIANVEKIQHDVDVYLAVPVLNDHQRADLHTDLGTLSRNLNDLKAALAAPKTTVAASDSVAAASVDSTYFIPIEDDSVVYLAGGSPNNPNGASFTFGDAVAWWKEVFGAGLNISRVRPTLLPGSKVLTPAGLAAARKLAVESTNVAPEDYNPLALAIVP